MQITLVQTELELAIREYVGRQLKVADGMSMGIELSATRGAEGFKAVIDILPIGTVIAQPKSAARPAFPSFGTGSQTVASAVVVPAPEASTEVSDESQGQTGNDVETVAEESGQSANSTETTAETTTLHTEAAPANSGARSLFKGLSRPKNS